MAESPRQALVIGAARSGRAAASLLAGNSFDVVCVDDSADRLSAMRAELGTAIETGRAADWIDRVRRCDLVVPSPGVPPGHPVLAAARAAGVEIVSELELAWRALDVPVLAVTGTNGKSTTVSLVADICRAAGRRVFAGGNLGSPLSEAVGGDAELAVVEVSSFQLEWVHEFRPHVGAILNLSPDHLDRHGDMATYLAVKLRLFERMAAEDFAVFPRGEPWAADAAGPVRASVSSFGLSEPAPGNRGSWVEESTRTVRGEDGLEVALSARWPVARHDLLNVAAAVEVARRAGIDADAMARGLAAFEPLEHRLALVRELDGVEYWNDSKATNVGATVAAMASFSDPVVLLAGGEAKDSDFDALASAPPGIKLLIAFGRAGRLLEQSLGARLDVAVAGGLAEAVALARARAEAGDVVLLAPACASFDEFSDYRERGRRYVELVQRLGA